MFNFLFRYCVYVHTCACQNDLYCVERDVKPYSLSALHVLPSGFSVDLQIIYVWDNVHR